MSIESWPSALQDYLNEENFSEIPQPATIRSEPDVGPAKVRNRYTKALKDVSCTINLPKADYDTFTNWYETTLGNGSNRFYFTHPIADDQRVYRFKDEPQITPIGGLEFMVSMTWEQMP